MVPEDLLFWMSALEESPTDDPNLLCVRHADAMMVPRGWTLDDRREDTLRLFKPPAVAAEDPPVPTRPVRRRPPSDPDDTPVQLQIDGTGEIDRPTVPDSHAEPAAESEPRPDAASAAPAGEPEPASPWAPDFDDDDDLDGLLSVTSPLLARAFRGTDRRR